MGLDSLLTKKVWNLDPDLRRYIEMMAYLPFEMPCSLVPRSLMIKWQHFLFIMQTLQSLNSYKGLKFLITVWWFMVSQYFSLVLDFACSCNGRAHIWVFIPGICSEYSKTTNYITVSVLKHGSILLTPGIGSLKSVRILLKPLANPVYVPTQVW